MMKISCSWKRRRIFKETFLKSQKQKSLCISAKPSLPGLADDSGVLELLATPGAVLRAALLLLHHPALFQGLQGADGRAALGTGG